MSIFPSLTSYTNARTACQLTPLVYYRPNARHHRPDAGTLGIQTRHRGADCNFGAIAGFACQTNNFDRAISDLRDLVLKYPTHQFRMSSRKPYLGLALHTAS